MTKIDQQSIYGYILRLIAIGIPASMAYTMWLDYRLREKMFEKSQRVKLPERPHPWRTDIPVAVVYHTPNVEPVPNYIRPMYRSDTNSNPNINTNTTPSNSN